jgi:hypothetical protein
VACAGVALDQMEGMSFCCIAKSRLDTVLGYRLVCFDDVMSDVILERYPRGVIPGVAGGGVNEIAGCF